MAELRHEVWFLVYSVGLVRFGRVCTPCVGLYSALFRPHFFVAFFLSFLLSSCVVGWKRGGLAC